jgi:hypothetical protein
MSSVSGRDPLNPNDPEFYAPPWLRERAKSGLSLSQAARLESITSSPISLPASLDIQLKNEVSEALWNPLDPEVIREHTGLARELDRRAALFSVAARVAAVAGVVAVVALLFVIMKPASRQSVAGSTPSDITGSTTTAPLQSSQGDVESKPALADPPQSSQGDVGSKPALAQFKALLASPPSQPATHEQSQQLLQRFLQWRKKANTTETSQ